MAVSYKKLWHILVDRNMKKKDLEEAAGITHSCYHSASSKLDSDCGLLGTALPG